MHELDEVWENLMNQAITRAKSSGRNDVADYLTLKASNDAARAASIKWLFDAAREIAADFNRQNSGILMEDNYPHRFSIGNSHLVGSVSRFRQGVRCLTVEAGWTRTPADGFMRGGALACAKISHFGMKNENEELILLRADDAPSWFAVDKHGKQTLFDSRNLQNHFQIFLGAI